MTLYIQYVYKTSLQRCGVYATIRLFLYFSGAGRGKKRRKKKPEKQCVATDNNINIILYIIHYIIYSRWTYNIRRTKIRPEIRVRDTAAATADKPPARLFLGVDAVGGPSVRQFAAVHCCCFLKKKFKGEGSHTTSAAESSSAAVARVCILYNKRKRKPIKYYC